MERAILMERRAKMAQPSMPLAGNALCECRGQPRFADAWLPRDQDDASFPGLGLRPPAEQQVHFFVAADERRSLRTQCLKPADNAALGQHLPNVLRLGEAGDCSRAEVLQIEQAAELLSRIFGDYQAARL